MEEASAWRVLKRWKTAGLGPGARKEPLSAPQSSHALERPCSSLGAGGQAGSRGPSPALGGTLGYWPGDEDGDSICRQAFN